MFENNCQINNINLRNVGEENLTPIRTSEFSSKIQKFLNENINISDDGQLIDPPKDVFNKFILDTMKEIYCNVKFPENKNIYYYKSKLYMYQNNEWSIVPKKNIIEIWNLTSLRIKDLFLNEIDRIENYK